MTSEFWMGGLMTGFTSGADWQADTIIITRNLAKRTADYRGEALSGGAGVSPLDIGESNLLWTNTQVVPAEITATNPRIRRSVKYHLCVPLYAEKFCLQPKAM